MVAARQVVAHPLDLVGKDIGGGHFHRGRQIDDHGPRRACIPGGDGGIAHGQRHLQLGHAESLGRVLQHPFGFGVLVGQALEQAHMVLHHGNDLRHLHAKDDFAEGGRNRVVQMHDHAACPDGAAHRGFDQVLAQLGDDHGRDIPGNQLFINQVTNNVEIRLRGRGKAHFDLLEAYAHQLIKQTQLALAVHGLEQRLIAVAQIGGQPDGRLRQRARRPLAVWQMDDGVGSVFVRRVGQHTKS